MVKSKTIYYEVVKLRLNNTIRVVLWLDGTSQNCVYEFFQLLIIRKGQTPIKALVALIDIVYPDWTKVPITKYRLLVDKLFELKGFQTQISCFIQPGTRTAVGIYGITNKCNNLSKADLDAARKKYSTCKDLDFQT